MNLIFSFVLSFHFLEARELISITHFKNIEKAIWVKAILISEFAIPQNLITISEEKSACLKNENALWHICVDENGEMRVPWIKQEIVKKSFSVFKKEGEML